MQKASVRTTLYVRNVRILIWIGAWKDEANEKLFERQVVAGSRQGNR